jgi:hypothetical protein
MILNSWKGRPLASGSSRLPNKHKKRFGATPISVVEHTNEASVMQTVLTTISGPGGSIDLELPGEVPVHDLLPELVNLWGPQLLLRSVEPFSWILAGQDGGSLDTNRSLIESGVMDGAVLVLRESASWARERQQAAQFVPEPVTPGPQTGGIGIRWNKAGLLPDT